jgi:hypothetical protein
VISRGSFFAPGLSRALWVIRDTAERHFGKPRILSRGHKRIRSGNHWSSNVLGPDLGADRTGPTQVLRRTSSGQVDGDRPCRSGPHEVSASAVVAFSRPVSPFSPPASASGLSIRTPRGDGRIFRAWLLFLTWADARERPRIDALWRQAVTIELCLGEPQGVSGRARAVRGRATSAAV